MKPARLANPAAYYRATREFLAAQDLARRTSTPAIANGGRVSTRGPAGDVDPGRTSTGSSLAGYAPRRRDLLALIPLL